MIASVDVNLSYEIPTKWIKLGLHIKLRPLVSRVENYRTSCQTKSYVRYQ